MSAPHLAPIPGAAADFAADLRAALPVLRTERLVLRAPELADAALWIALLAADEAGDLGGPYSEAQGFIEFQAAVGGWLLRGHGPWAVCTLDGALQGFVLIGFEVSDQEPELGFLFAPEARGKGYAFEAATAARRHALETLKMPTLVSYIAMGNEASKNTAARLQARFEGEEQGLGLWRHAPLEMTQ